jgi:hypothetical protein
MMEPKLILYEDLKRDYHHLLFSSDLRFAGQYNNLTPSVTQGSKRQTCMWTHVSSLRGAGWISSALVPVQFSKFTPKFHYAHQNVGICTE